jgi:hypothetical protein
LKPSFVGVSISINYDQKTAQSNVDQLTESKNLPKLIIGGAGATKLKPSKNFQKVTELFELLEIVSG